MSLLFYYVYDGNISNSVCCMDSMSESINNNLATNVGDNQDYG